MSSGLLDADHHRIHDAIDDFATTAQDCLRRIGPAEGALTSCAVRRRPNAAVVNRLGRLLRQHLADEEDLVMPLLIERAHADPDLG